MKVRYLGWAGVEIEHDGQTLLIDYAADGSAVFQDRRFAEPSNPAGAIGALVTHLHSDHADPDTLTLALAPGAQVFRPEPAPGAAEMRKWTAPAEEAFYRSKLQTHIMPAWTERRIGPFRIIAVPAVDGLGDPQRSYIVEASGVRVLHAGDTMNHGYWWAIARWAGPIDCAFVPINAPVVNVPHLQPPSPFHAVMSPEEAVVACKIVSARQAVPIHYGNFDVPDVYVEAADHIHRFRRHAAELNVQARIPAEGEWFSAARASC